MKVEAQVPLDDSYDDAAKAYAEVAGREPDPAPDAAPAGGKESDAGASAEPIRARGEGGKFVKKEAKPNADADDKRGANRDAAGTGAEVADGAAKPAAGKDGKQPAADAADAAKADGKADTAGSVTGGPPPSFSVKSKAAWDSLPEHVRADIVKREQDAANGLKALQDYKDLKPFAEMAAKEGVSLAKAMERYVNFESVLKQNLGQGLAKIAENYGYTPEAAATLFAKMAMHYSGGKIKMAGPGQQAGHTPQSGVKDPLLEMLEPALQPFKQQIEDLKGKLTSQEKAALDKQGAELEKAITAFADDPENKFFPDLYETMTFLMENGKVPITGDLKANLKAAYDLAAKMHPEVSEALIEQRLEAEKVAARKKEQEAADKAKKASRSITGSRVPGTVVKDGNEDPEGDDDIEAVVRRAYRMHAQA